MSDTNILNNVIHILTFNSILGSGNDDMLTGGIVSIKQSFIKTLIAFSEILHCVHWNKLVKRCFST